MNKYLARELHDAVSQRLAAVKIEIDVLEHKPPRSSAQLRARLRRLSAQVEALTRTMHEISRQLHPAILEDLGLADALEAECQVFSRLYGNPILFHREDVPDRVPDSVALCLYRIAQESLRNVARHAPGAAVSVILSGTAEEICLSIEDTGPGFSRRTSRPGLGLISMQERARLVNGKLRVVSRLGKGTTVEVRAPRTVSRARHARRHTAG
jgi:signal transduction histidine kinase